MIGQDKQCPSCNQPLLGHFCHQCGEKAFDKKDLSINKVSQHVFTSVTDVDGKFIKSFWLLLSRPGQLTIDYLKGKRKNRLSPFQLLLIVNILFFLVAAYRGNTAFTTTLVFHTNSANFIHQPIASKMVEDHIIKTNESRESYAIRFNSMVEAQAKSLVMLMVPIFALIILILFPKQPYPVVGSLVFATHLFSIMLLIHAFISPILSKTLVWLVYVLSLHVGEDQFEWTYSLTLVALFAVYFMLAINRVYQKHIWANALRTVFYVIAVYWIYLVYRMILFFTTFYLL